MVTQTSEAELELVITILHRLPGARGELMSIPSVSAQRDGLNRCFKSSFRAFLQSMPVLPSCPLAIVSRLNTRMWHPWLLEAIGGKGGGERLTPSVASSHRFLGPLRGAFTFHAEYSCSAGPKQRTFKIPVDELCSLTGCRNDTKVPGE